MICGKLCKKYTGKLCSVFTRILFEYGRIWCKKEKKKIVLTVVLCSDSFYESIISILNCFHSVKMFSTEYFWESCHAEKTILPTP